MCIATWLRSECYPADADLADLAMHSFEQHHMQLADMLSGTWMAFAARLMPDPTSTGDAVRHMASAGATRVDGRGLSDLRPIHAEVRCTRSLLVAVVIAVHALWHNHPAPILQFCASVVEPRERQSVS